METKTQQDIDFISTMASITETFTGINSWWIGLENVDSQWTWSYSGAGLGDIDNWGDGEGEVGGNKSCVILAKLDGSFSWQNVQCNLTSPTLAAVCQQCSPGSDCSAGAHLPLGCHNVYQHM